MSTFKLNLNNNDDNKQETNDIIEDKNENKNNDDDASVVEESDDEDEQAVGDEEDEDEDEVADDEVADVDEDEVADDEVADVDEDEAVGVEDEAVVDEDEDEVADDDVADVDEDEESGLEDEDGEDDEDDEDNENKKSSVKKIKYKSTKKPILTTNNYTYNVDNELFIDDQQFEKIDDSLKYNYSKIYHPECIHKNFDEMLKLTFIKRENNIIKDINHKTLPFLTKYEKTKAIGLRVKQLNSGSKPFINLQKVFNTNMVLDTNLIAERELMMKKIPFIISRPITNRKSEFWNIKDLEIIC